MRAATRASVSPRIRVEEGTESLLLTDFVDAVLERDVKTTIHITGDGKTTALAHLAARYANDSRINIFDDVYLFFQADLRNAGLAEIDWQDCDLRNADLRGAAFHLGSTRCGLVGSPYPSHGTRTGFYTDDYEELAFRQPEEVRKANLGGCDLRGANLDGVDFYLVDLRKARFDRARRRQLIATGAILDSDQL